MTRMFDFGVKSGSRLRKVVCKVPRCQPPVTSTQRVSRMCCHGNKAVQEGEEEEEEEGGFRGLLLPRSRVAPQMHSHASVSRVKSSKFRRFPAGSESLTSNGEADR
ncbi:Hypothetical predicted protein [Xyrichtys novacula]|uniref:Uncharacterized protein n=1 Tax=Xyrichtys novacula TaxID=13765 RepID=A0AAV1HEX1_XYRNO|nr:Hypothetical predicted protein [Xyrichtys novacula]